MKSKSIVNSEEFAVPTCLLSFGEYAFKTHVLSCEEELHNRSSDGVAFQIYSNSRAFICEENLLSIPPPLFATAYFVVVVVVAVVVVFYYYIFNKRRTVASQLENKKLKKF
jgi:hypothetical protein